MKKYKFKNDLKVDVKPEKTYREFVREIKNIERGRE